MKFHKNQIDHEHEETFRVVAQPKKRIPLDRASSYIDLSIYASRSGLNFPSDTGDIDIQTVFDVIKS